MDITTPNPGPNDKHWHVNIGDKKQGPFSDTKMAELAASRKLKPKSMAWWTGLPNRLPCNSIPELAPLFGNQAARQRPELELRILLPSKNPLPELKERMQPLIPHALSAMTKSQVWLKGLNPRHLAIVGSAIGLLFLIWIWRSRFYTPPHDDFLSIFTAELNGKTEEAVMIEKPNKVYLLAAKQWESWARPKPVHPIERARTWGTVRRKLERGRAPWPSECRRQDRDPESEERVDEWRIHLQVRLIPHDAVRTARNPESRSQNSCPPVSRAQKARSFPFPFPFPFSFPFPFGEALAAKGDTGGGGSPAQAGSSKRPARG